MDIINVYRNRVEQRWTVKLIVSITVLRKTMDFFIVWKAAELHECQLSEVGYKHENY